MTREGETLGRGRDGVGLAERIYLTASIAPRRRRFQRRRRLLPANDAIWLKGHLSVALSHGTSQEVAEILPAGWDCVDD